jgi:hypothetical protein
LARAASLADRALAIDLTLYVLSRLGSRCIKGVCSGERFVIRNCDGSNDHGWYLA